MWVKETSLDFKVFHDRSANPFLIQHLTLFGLQLCSLLEFQGAEKQMMFLSKILIEV